MSDYVQPLPRHESPRPDHALPLAGGRAWFTEALRHRRGAAPERIGLEEIPEETRARLSAPRAPLYGMAMDRPRLMGIVNVTPDSFSDGGAHGTAQKAFLHAQDLICQGADIIDIGGESTRPGAQAVPPEAEIARIEPVVSAVAGASEVPISIDTRKVDVAHAAVRAGARMVNDVSGFTFDRMLAPYCAREGLPVCVMHARGDPETMQENPRYDDVLLDVYDFLAAQVIMLAEVGIPREKIIVDPGIGFGKTIKHNLALLNGIALFHSLGCPILLGASRKGFIGKLSGGVPPAERAPGSAAVSQWAASQGVQILRVHDVAETAQALALWQAITFNDAGGHA